MSATKIYNEKYSALKLDEIENIEEKKAVLDSFSDKYLLLPEAWIIRLQLEIAANASYETVKELLKRALFDFYTPKFLEAIPFNFQQRFMKEVMFFFFEFT
uniref:Uncharacterized protein n=1 Tax=Panagrolaimus davidi TaxID=227884 RepID=A0A914QGN8_9BILA